MTFTESRNRSRHVMYIPEFLEFNEVQEYSRYKGEDEILQGSLKARMKDFQKNGERIQQDDFRGLVSSCLLADYEYQKLK